MPSYIHDLGHAAVLQPALPPAAVGGNGETSAVDMADTDGPCSAIQALGGLTGGAWSGRFQESADGAAWSEIAASAFPAVPSGNSVQVVTFPRTLRYVRYVYSFDGGSGSCYAVAVVAAQRKLAA